MTNVRAFTQLGAVLALSSMLGISRADEDPPIQCTVVLATYPAFSHINAKLPLGDIHEISFTLLANDAIPNVQERNEIAARFNRAFKADWPNLARLFCAPPNMRTVVCDERLVTF